METYICLLRGINVGGHKKIKMAELREQLGELSFTNIRTYIQSGNIIFQSEEDSLGVLAANIREKIASHYPFTVPVQVWSLPQWGYIRSHNPYLPDWEEDIAKLHVTLLSDSPEESRINDLSKVHFPPDLFIYKDKVVYLCCPKGYGRTKLTNSFWERRLGVEATTRNWKTVCKLFELATE